MDTIQLKKFADEAELRLKTVRNAILVALQESGPVDLNFYAHGIKSLLNTANGLPAGGVLSVLEAIDAEFANSSASGAMTDVRCRTLLDLISHAEAEVLKLQYSADDDAILDIGSLIDQSFDVIQLDAAFAIDQLEPDFAMTDPVAEPVTDTWAEDEFEPDAEMLEIFAEEADDLLANIDSNVAALFAAPGDRNALWEVRRHAHTFKGASGIIGLKKPSELAHRIEDLLDHLAHSETVPDASVLELIRDAARCLRAITKGDAADATAELAAGVYARFDETMKKLVEGPAPAAVAETTPSPVEAAIAAEPLVEPASPPAPAAEPEPQIRRPIVRVSIARLDELVRIVRDLVVSRSTMEQRLIEFDAQIESLGRTIRQLQTANTRIENDFEASMLASYTPSTFYSARARRNQDLNETADAESFDSLEFDRYTEFHESSRELSEAIQECTGLGTSLEGLKGAFEAVIEDQRRLIEETQAKVMQIRLIKFESLVTRLERAVRVTCEEENKRAEILVQNQDVELDTDVVDSLVEPLMHLIRNAVVHGIEPPHTRRLLGKPEVGRITVSVSNEHTHVELKVSDDGRGVSASALKSHALEAGLVGADEVDSLPDEDLVSLMFMPGVTTAERLTMSAGRGVGMSIVKESVEARHGTISVETAEQRGTTFTVRVPLAFAVAQAVLVRSEHCLAAIPLKVVKRFSEFSATDFRDDVSGQVVGSGSAQFPVLYLADHFAQPRNADRESLNSLMIETGDERFALVVDEILRTEEIAVKPLNSPLDAIECVFGAAVLGDGSIVPVLDVLQLLKNRDQNRPLPVEPIVEEAPPYILVVDDSPVVRHMTSKVMARAGWEVMTAKDGIEALEILQNPNPPAVILSDVEMPRMDGYEFVAAVNEREELRQIPIVFITSRVSEKHRERAAELGVSDYLTKPFVESELLRTVERLAVANAELVI